MLPHTFFEQSGLLKAYPDFLSETESTALVQLMQKSPSESAQVLREPVPGQKTRSTLDVLVPQTTITAIQNKLFKLLPELNLHFQAQATQIHLLQFLRYLVGDYFLPHQDWYENMGTSVSPRLISFVLFLNQTASQNTSECGYTGGELVFYNRHRGLGQTIGLPLQAKTGLLIAFQPKIVHEVRKVQTGERFTVAGWFH
jgi:predicted 2-oxoglutarate/Fe(II)-dependent dioxygenase YbiX